VILTDRGIRTHLARGTIIIDPAPVVYDSTAVDLTLDPLPFIVAWRFPRDDRHRTLDHALAAGAIERQRWHDQNPDHKLGALCAQCSSANEWIVSASVLGTPVLNLVREEQGATSSGQRH
jgi:hypothetical protein